MMYSRGQFAIVGKVGRKALRIYDEEGLLVPAFVDGENGYNYYDESQLAVLEKIKTLKKIGLSLYEIKQVLKGKAAEKELVDSRIREMDSRLQEARELASAEEKDKPRKSEAAPNPDIRPFEKCRCLFIEENVELEDLGISVGKLYEKAAKEKASPAGSHFVLYEDFSDKDRFSMKTCLPVLNYEGTDCMDAFEEKCLHVNFTEGFSKVAKAHSLIKKFAESRHIKLSGKIYEVYNKDMSVDVYYGVDKSGNKKLEKD